MQTVEFRQNGHIQGGVFAGEARPTGPLPRLKRRRLTVLGDELDQMSPRIASEPPQVRTQRTALPLGEIKIAEPLEYGRNEGSSGRFIVVSNRNPDIGRAGQKFPDLRNGLERALVHIDHHRQMIDQKPLFQTHMPLETRPPFQTHMPLEEAPQVKMIWNWYDSCQK